MKKITKKVTIILIIVTLFNFIFCNCITYADPIINDDSTITYSKDSYDKLTDEGKVEIDGDTEEVKVSTSGVGTASGAVASVSAPIFMIATNLLSSIAISGGVTGGDGYTDSPNSAYNTGMFTIGSLVFGEFLLFNTNIYETSETLNPSISPTTVTKIIDGIKGNVIGWFYIIRLVAIALIIVLLIFTGIRLSISNLAEERARYKEVIKSWVIGLAFIFAFPYIVVLLNTIIDYIMDILWSIRISLEESGYSNFEYECLKTCINGITKYGGLKAFAYAIEYIAFAVIEVLFFGKYFIRSIKIFMLTFLAPILAIMDIFAKLRGGEGILKRWTSQYIMSLLMQPLHAAIYLIFMFTLSEIAIRAPLLAIVLLWAMLRAEKIIKVILEIDYGKITTLFTKPE